jgi:ABC-type uncharacterized transport system permease subunit
MRISAVFARYGMSLLARELAVSAFALLAALAISAIIVLLAGSNPLVAFSALTEGAFGSLQGLSETGVKACPLLITGLAIAVAFRTGVWNIGAEGQLLVGAIAMAGLGSRSWAAAWAALPMALAAGALGGAVWASLAGLLKVHRNVNEIISTIMLNFIALGLVSYLVHGPLMESAGRYPQSEAIAEAMRLPRLVPSFRFHAGTALAVAAAAACYVFLFWTVIGYQLQAVGWNADAARLAGIRPGRCTLLALVASGALAGLAGAIEVSAITYRLYERFSPGYGFTAIAVALLGRLHPFGVILAALLFGALEAGSSSMQRVAGVSSVLVDVIQAVVILCLITVERRSWWRAAT